MRIPCGFSYYKECNLKEISRFTVYFFCRDNIRFGVVKEGLVYSRDQNKKTDTETLEDETTSERADMIRRGVSSISEGEVNRITLEDNRQNDVGIDIFGNGEHRRMSI